MNANICVNEMFKISCQNIKSGIGARKDSFKGFLLETAEALQTPGPAQSINAQCAPGNCTDESAPVCDAEEDNGKVFRESFLAGLLQLGLPAGTIMNFPQLPETTEGKAPGRAEDASAVSAISPELRAAGPVMTEGNGIVHGNGDTVNSTGGEMPNRPVGQEIAEPGEVLGKEPEAADTVFILREAPRGLTGAAEEPPRIVPDTVAAGTEEPEKENLAPDVAVHHTEPQLVKIKVGDGAEVSKTDFSEKLAEKIEVGIVRRDNEFIIQLAPKELGKILIKISFEAEKATVTMFCANPKTLSLLLENASGIGLIVRNNTGTPVTVNVEEKTEIMRQGQEDGNRGNGQGESRSGRENKENIAAAFISRMRLGLLEAGEQTVF